LEEKRPDMMKKEAELQASIEVDEQQKATKEPVVQTKVDALTKMQAFIDRVVFGPFRIQISESVTEKTIAHKGMKLDRSSSEIPLGIEVYHGNGKTLVVKAIDSGGLVHAWNQSHPEAELQVHDQIVEVNGIQGNSIWLQEECQKSALLTLTVQYYAEASILSATKGQHDSLSTELTDKQIVSCEGPKPLRTLEELMGEWSASSGHYGPLKLQAGHYFTSMVNGDGWARIMTSSRSMAHFCAKMVGVSSCSGMKSSFGPGMESRLLNGHAPNPPAPNFLRPARRCSWTGLFLKHLLVLMCARGMGRPWSSRPWIPEALCTNGIEVTQMQRCSFTTRL